MQLSHRGSKSMSTPRDQVEGVHAGASYRVCILPVSFTSKRKVKGQTNSSEWLAGAMPRPCPALVCGMARGWGSPAGQASAGQKPAAGSMDACGHLAGAHLFSCS